MNEKILIPNAPILVESTRSVGYSFESALADIIDNSVGKGAKEINVYFNSQDKPYLSVVDNACGMSREELENAMQYGSKSSLETRDKNDLGRFGLGLKMASLSQCRCLTVITKKDGQISAARWDLDYIIKTNEWTLIEFDKDEINELLFSDQLEDINSGTVVIWEKFDRLENSTNDFVKSFDAKIENARNHISLVFHRFIDGDDQSQNVKILFNGKQIKAIDPFLRSNNATQPLEEQTFRINGEVIKVKPYILPYISKLTSKDKAQIGDVNNLRQSQGFYIYRNKRLIIWGTWFRLIKNYELNKLARVRVDIPNSLDSIWEIDIKKSTASLPDIIKKNLVSIVESTVGKSERVYKYRGRKVTNSDLQCIWNVIDDRGAFHYQINRDFELYKQLENHLDESGIKYLDTFLKVVEDSFPYGDAYYRMAKNESDQTRANMDFESVYEAGLEMIDSAKNKGMDIKTLLHTMENIDFFVKYPEVLKKLKEDFGDE